MRDRILAALEANPTLRVNQLAEQLEVSTETIRRDLAELDQVLEQHELVKVKVAAEDREARDAAIAALADGSRAELVSRIGHVAVLYRRSRDKPLVILPRA